MKPTHLDLFSGIGGFSLAFESVGFKTIGFAEIDHFASAVIKKHWPDVPNFGDVRKLCRRACDCHHQGDDGEVYCPLCKADFGDCDCVGSDQFLDEYGQPTIITAGFPCQDISNAGTTHEGGLRGLDGARSGLWFECFRIVRELMPRFVLVENVTAVRVRGADRICADLESIGYACQPFVVGVWLAGGQTKGDRGWFMAVQEADRPGLEGNERQEVARENNGRQHADITRPDWGRATPRLRGEPDGIPGWMDSIKCYGNSVSPQVAQIFAKAIRRSLDDDPGSTIFSLAE